MTRIPPIPPFDDLDDDQFNTAFEALLHGDSHSRSHVHHTGSGKLDPEMESTIDQLFDWARTSGFADEPAALFSHEQQEAEAYPHDVQDVQGPSEYGPAGRRNGFVGTVKPSPTEIGMGQRRPTHDHRMRRILMSTLSGLAAAMLIGFGIYGAIPLFGPDHDPEPTTTTIAFVAGQGSPTAALASGGDGNTTTTPSTTGDGVVIGEPGANASGVDPVTSDECTIPPKSRADVLQILSSPPGSYADIVNAKNMRGGPRQVTFDDIPVDQLNQVFREWQACVKFGSTWQYLALETDYMIRADIYGAQSWDRGPLLKPYSQATINDLLDGRELVDNDRRARWLEAWQKQLFPSLPETVLVIDQSQGAQFFVSEDGTYIASVGVAKLNQVSGEQRPRNGTVDFELVNGQWMIANVSPWLEF